MATSTSLRTVWLTLRATNYTSHVFTTVVRQLGGLEAAEKRQVIQSLRMANAATSAAVMFSTLGNQMGGMAGQILGTASQFMYVVTAIGYVRAILPLLNKSFLTHTMTLLGVKMAYWQVAVSAAAAFGAFAIAMTLFKGLSTPVLALIAVLGGLVAILWAVYVAESAASMGVAMVIGGIAAAAAMTIASNYQSHAMGTRMVGATGPAFVHQGEIIYNPSTGRPTQVQNDLADGGARTVIYEQPVTIQELNTKTDIDDVNEKLRKGLRKSAHGTR